MKKGETINKEPFEIVNKNFNLNRNVINVPNENEYENDIEVHELCYPPCVESGMGGQTGSFINVPIQKNGKCIIECGKKIQGDSIREHEFYKYLYSDTSIPYINAFRNFTPIFHGTILENGKEYFILENIKRLVGDNPLTLDFKIGFQTAFVRNKGIVGRTRHEVINRYLSTSRKYGVRLEGATGKFEQPKISLYDTLINQAKQRNGSGYKKIPGKKQKLFNLIPSFIFDIFFQGDTPQIQTISNTLQEMEERFITPNFKGGMDNQDAIAFIGSSLLLSRGSDGAVLKLIDFAHPFWKHTPVDPTLFRRILENYTNGLLQFKDEFDRWSSQYNIGPYSAEYVNTNYNGKQQQASYQDRPNLSGVVGTYPNISASVAGAKKYSTYKNRKYVIRYGPRGGKYILVKGVKVRI